MLGGAAEEEIMWGAFLKCFLTASPNSCLGSAKERLKEKGRGQKGKEGGVDKWEWVSYFFIYSTKAPVRSLMAVDGASYPW